MKFQGPDSELLGMPADSLLMGACWGPGPGPDQYKLLLDAGADDKGALDSLDTKVAMDTLDSLLLSSTDDEVHAADNFAELKPLPPFTGYTGHLSINGISGHHYHAIAAPLSPEPSLVETSLVETNNNNTQVTNHNHVHTSGNGSRASSSSSNSGGSNGSNNVLHFKGGSEQGGATLYYSADHGVVSSSTGLDCGDIKEEAADYTSLLDNEDIAALIGSAIADTTVPSVVDNGDASRDSWMDLDAWIDTACSSDSKAILSADSLQDFAASSQFSSSPPPSGHNGSSGHPQPTTLQSLLGYPVQQNPQPTQQQNQQPMLVKREATPSFSHGLLVKREATTSFQSQQPQSQQHVSLLHSRLQNGPPPSPPGHVVSTTDGLGPGLGGHGGLGPGGLRYHYSPTSTTATPSPSKKSRNRSKSKASGNNSNSVTPSSSSLVYSADGLMGKEKPVHRCTICSRGFLNKSNIKVHLRTHTGEKPFRCEVCGKAFRQKAHLLKHAMIHKRIGRDDPHGYPHELRCD